MSLAKEKDNQIIINLLNGKMKQYGAPSLNPDELSNLAEFYKKKTFAKSNSTKLIKSVIQDSLTFDLAQKIEPISISADLKPTTSKVLEFDSDSDAYEEDDKHSLSDIEDKNLSKKFRLSSSPVEDTLKWMKNDSTTNFELCLTGKIS